MKRKGKAPLISLLAILCVVFCGFFAMFLVDGFLNTVATVNAAGNNITDFFIYHWENIKNMFTIFTPTETVPYVMWWYSYLAIGAAALILILIIVGIVVCCKKHSPAKIAYIIPMLLGAAFIVDFLPNINMYIDGVVGLFGREPTWHYVSSSVAFAPIWSFIALVCAGVFLVLLFVVYGLGLAYVCNKGLLEEEGHVAFPLEETAESVEQPVEPVEQPVEEQPVEPVEGEYSMAAAIDETIVVEEPSEPEIEIEPVEDFAPVVEPEAVEEQPIEPAPAPAPEPAPAPASSLDEAKLAAMLKDIVRDIVKDEIARNNLNAPQQPVQPASITGATFGGPLVVQYFNGFPTNAAPAPAPVPAPAPAPAPEPAKPAPAPEPAKPAPAPVAAPVTVAVPAPAPANKEEKKPIERIPFPERLLASDKELQSLYSELKNELLSWGVKSRVSNNGDTFRLHTKTYAKITVAGKSLKFHFALDPNDYKDSTIPVADASDKGLYVDIPLVFKVKSGLSVKRCKQLIRDCCEKDGLTQGEVLSTNWIKELKALQK